MRGGGGNNIRDQLGEVLSCLTQAAGAGHLLVRVDLAHEAIDRCGPKLREDEEAELRGILDAASGRYAAASVDRDGSLGAGLERAVHQVVSKLLRLMSLRGIYSFKQPGVGREEPEGDSWQIEVSQAAGGE